jgi:SAM-dependent methyltransferase
VEKPAVTEWNASDYASQSSVQEAMAGEQLARLELAGTERVLDVGCGDGKVTARIAARVPQGSVVGIDPSRNMISFAAERFSAADQESALRSIRAALKPGGRAHFCFIPDGPRRSIEDFLEDARQSQRWAGHFPGFQKPFVHFTPEEYRSLAERNGFDVVRVERESREWDYQKETDFAGFVRATFVVWSQLIPESEKQAFVADVLARYRTEIGLGPGEQNLFKFYQMQVVLAARA